MPAKNTIAAAHARADLRDREIVRIGRRIDAVTGRFAEHLAGVLAVDGNKFPFVISRVDQVFRAFPDAMAAALESGLADLAVWSHEAAAGETVARVPVGVWLMRSLEPFGEFPKKLRATEKRIDPPARDPDPRRPDKKRAAYRRMLKLESPAEQRKTIAQWELPPPSRQQVRRLIDATSASDGLSPMERVKTIARSDLGNLRRLIVGELSRPFEDGQSASAVQSLTAKVKKFFDEEEGWKAKRIARTEAIRISEQVRREADEAVADIYTARRYLRRGAQPCEICDPWDNTVFVRDEAGDYVSDSGELLPEIPLHPNCVCFTVPELRPEIAAQVPPRNVGKWYAQATAHVPADAGAQYAAAGA